MNDQIALELSLTREEALGLVKLRTHTETF